MFKVNVEISTVQMEDKKVFTCHLEAEIGQYPEYCIQDICCGVYKQPNRFVSAILWLLMSLLIIALTCCLIYLWCTYVENKDPPSGHGKIKPETREQISKEKETPKNVGKQMVNEEEPEEEDEDEEENEEDEAENEEAEEEDEDEGEDTDSKGSAKSPPSQKEEESSKGKTNNNLKQNSIAKESVKSPDNNLEKQNNLTEPRQMKNNVANSTKQYTPNRPFNEADDYSSNDSKDTTSQNEEEESSKGTINNNLPQNSNAKESAKSQDNNLEKQNNFTEPRQVKNDVSNANKQKTPNRTLNKAGDYFSNDSKDIPSQNEEEESSKGTTNNNSSQNSKNRDVKITYIRERYSFPDVTDQQGSQAEKRDSEEYFNYSYKKLDMKMESL